MNDTQFHSLFRQLGTQFAFAVRFDGGHGKRDILIIVPDALLDSARAVLGKFQDLHVDDPEWGAVQLEALGHIEACLEIGIPSEMTKFTSSDWSFFHGSRSEHERLCELARNGPGLSSERLIGHLDTRIQDVRSRLDQTLYFIGLLLSEDIRLLYIRERLDQVESITREHLADVANNLPEMIRGIQDSATRKRLQTRWLQWSEVKLDEGKDPELEGLCKALALHYQGRDHEAIDNARLQ